MKQESRPFGPGWAADIKRICSWTSRGQCTKICKVQLYNCDSTKLYSNMNDNDLGLLMFSAERKVSLTASRLFARAQFQISLPTAFKIDNNFR